MWHPAGVRDLDRDIPGVFDHRAKSFHPFGVGAPVLRPSDCFVEGYARHFKKQQAKNILGLLV